MMKSHPFFIVLIIIQVILIFYMNQAHNAWMKAHSERNLTMIDDIRQLIDDGHGREIGKIWSDSHKQHDTSWFNYYSEGIAQLREKKTTSMAAKPLEALKTEDVPKAEDDPKAGDVPKAEGGNQP